MPLIAPPAAQSKPAHQPDPVDVPEPDDGSSSGIPQVLPESDAFYLPDEEESPPAPDATPIPKDHLLPSQARVAALAKAIRGSRAARTQFCDEFSRLPAMQLVRQRMEDLGTPPDDPIGVFIEICGLYDMRQRDCVVSMAALLERNEAVLEAFLHVFETFLVEVQKARSATEGATVALHDSATQTDTMTLFLSEFCRRAPDLTQRTERLFGLVNEKSIVNVIFNWLTPVVVFVLAILIDRLLFNR